MITLGVRIYRPKVHDMIIGKPVINLEEHKVKTNELEKAKPKKKEKEDEKNKLFA